MSPRRRARAPGTARAAAAAAIHAVLRDGRSLDAALEAAGGRLVDPRERGFARELAFGVMRWLGRLEALVDHHLERGLKPRDADIRALLLVAFYQIDHLDVPDHAAVSEAVEEARRTGKRWAGALVNAVLRRYLRDRLPALEAIEPLEVARTAHPAWLADALREAWPDDVDRVLREANRRPPLTLRANRGRTTREALGDALRERGFEATPTVHAPDGIIVRPPRAVDALPGFGEGWFAVQDAAAQLAAPLLAPAPGERILDACAAPGGKTGHLLELEPRLGAVLALDVDAARTERMARGLARLGHAAEVRAADASRPQDWWDGRPFDAILIDAPCTGTGVIRRRPDIKRHRRPDDVEAMTRTQSALLAALWPLLAADGRLLYATCSILPAENDRVIDDFTHRNGDARARPIAAAWGRPTTHGRQVLPGEDAMDGFYFALVHKAGA